MPRNGRWSEGRTRAPALALALVACLSLPGCGPDRVGIGQACVEHADCATELQCLRSVCTPLCHRDAECGDGFSCEAEGVCREVVSEIGQACIRELDCGPGQTCLLDEAVGDDETLASSCQPDHVGGVTGSECQNDDECRNYLCSLGRCTELCVAESDCPHGMTCASMPKVMDAAAPPFRGCLQKEGTLALTFEVTTPSAELRVPVPDTALSLALIAQIDDEAQLVGAKKVASPSRTLYTTPFEDDAYYENALRHLPALGISTLLIPNTPAMELEAGVYDIQISSFRGDALGPTGTAIPEVSVVYKLSPARVLDLHLRFLDLDDHPCTEAREPALDVVDALSAQDSLTFRSQFVNRLRSIFEQADIELGTITYADVLDQHDLDGLLLEDLPKLLGLADEPGGITIFFVRSISPAGIQAIAGGSPGPPRKAGTAASGIAVSYDTLCYQDWPAVARATAHEIGRYLGLFRNREPDGRHGDPIEDSGDGSDNLMFYADSGGTELSPGQSQVLRLNPVLR